MLTAITGASGHVGANLARELLRRGRPVRALVHADTRALEGLPVERFSADLADADSLAAAFAGAGVVYHLAACIRLEREHAALLQAVNVAGTGNVVDACRRSGVRRLIHFSSIHAYSHLPADRPIDEDRPLVADGQGSAYDSSKAAAERIVLAEIEAGLDAVIVSPTAVLGPYDFRPSPLGSVVARLARGQMRWLVAGGYDWVDVRDVVSGALAAETHGRTGHRYLLSGHWCSVRELAKMVGAISGRDVRRTTVPAWLARGVFAVWARAARACGRTTSYRPEVVDILQRHRDVVSAKAEREFGYRARPLPETVADTIAWFQREHS